MKKRLAMQTKNVNARQTTVLPCPANGKKVLAVGDGLTFAHIIRPLELVRSLSGRGHELHYACDPRYQMVLEKEENLTYHRITSVSPTLIQQRNFKGKPLRSYNELREMLLEDLELLEKVEPNIVVSDFRHSLSIAAKLKGIPYVCLTNVQWSPHVPRNYPIFEHQLVRILGKKISAVVFKLTGPLIYKLHSRAFNRLLKENGLQPVRHIEEMFCLGDYTLYMDIPELFTLKTPLPSHHHFIGPVAWKTKLPLPPWWQQLPTGQPVVFVSPGSSGNPKYFRWTIECLQEMDVTIIVAAAGQLKLSTDIKKRIFISDYLPLDIVMARADVVVCNGGSGMVYQALEVGTPILAIPSNLDQHLITSKIVNAGAGLSIPAGVASIEKIVVKVKRLLEEDTFTNNAAAYAELINKYDAKNQFIGFIEKMARIQK